jgi:hypothetical protein
MIACSICGTINDEFAVLCVSCKGYLQAKVDNLNLFETLWGLVESPRMTFRRIILAAHKNYGLLLSMLAGMFIVYAIFWLRDSGSAFANVLSLLGYGFVGGALVGIPLVVLVGMMGALLCRLLGGRLSVRNAFALTAYSAMPVIVSLVAVVPVEIAAFGNYLFDRNPSPWVLQPAMYAILLGLHGLALLWSLVLFVRGMAIGGGLSRGRALVFALIAWAGFGASVYALHQA